MTVRRWPALLLIPALLIGGAVLDRRDRGDEQIVEVGEESETPSVDDEIVDSDLMPVVREAGAESTTWYCASGTGSGNDAVTRQTVIVANYSDEPRRGSVTVFPNEGDRVEEPIEVAPQGRAAIATSTLVEAPYASALVELDGGEVAVTQFVEGSSGRETSECATSASSTWYVASGATTADAALYYAIFNPFPDEAIVDMSFETTAVAEDGTVESGTRNPEAFQGYVIPARSVRYVNVGEVVTRRNEVSATITARTGRVVVDRIQSYGGQEGIKGLAVSLAEPTAAETWFYPAGPASDGISERYVIYNPTDEEATVDLEVAVDDPATNGSVEPFELDIPRRSAVTLATSDEQWAHVPKVGHSVVVRSLNGVPVVTERTIIVQEPAGNPGIATTAGTPLIATTWTVATGDLQAAVGRSLSIQNPDPEEGGTVTVQGVVEDEVFVIDEIELAGGQRLNVVLDDLSDRERYSLLVESSIPIVIEETYQLADPAGRAAVRGVPLQGTTAIPDPLG